MSWIMSLLNQDKSSSKDGKFSNFDHFPNNSLAAEISCILVKWVPSRPILNNNNNSNNNNT